MANGQCPNCKGERGHEVFACGPNHHFEPMYMPCYLCKDAGEVTEGQVQAFERGKELRTLRMAKDHGQIGIAKIRGIGVGQWSDLEQGRATVAEIDKALAWLETVPNYERKSDACR